MRSIIWLLLLGVVAVVAATTLGGNDGLVTIYWSGWRTELSLNLFILLVLVGVALLFSAAQALRSLLTLPERASRWRALRRERAAHAALHEALGEYFSARYSRAHKAALKAIALRDEVSQLRGDAEFAMLARILAASGLHRLQNRAGRDAQMQALWQQAGPRGGGHGVEDGARLLAAEWAVEDRDGDLASELLEQLPAGVARRTQALRLKLQASRLQRRPLQALSTARLLAKHQGFTPLAARGLLRSLAAESIDEAYDLQQLQRLWEQFDAADRRDAAVAARAARRAVQLGAAAAGREWLRPFWEHPGELDRDDRDAVALALLEAVPGIEAEWLPRLEAALEAHGMEAPVAAAVGIAYADRQLWGKAKGLLEQSAAAADLPARVRRRCLRALAQLARERGDETAAQAHERAAAATD
ncbi:MAG: porphyrin biosynthesis protein [Rubrivivax sp. SCN 71-131]|nr:MAG: porphyrin biosynthesis protein [Rubrivivax sp. SCN 71-131]